MTFELLYSNRREQDKIFSENLISNLMEKSQTPFLFLEKGLFYEHKIETSGIIYEKEELEKYIQEFNFDPIDDESINKINRIDENIFTRNMINLVIYELGIPENKPTIIKNNYRLFLVLERKK